MLHVVLCSSARGRSANGIILDINREFGYESKQWTTATASLSQLGCNWQPQTRVEVCWLKVVSKVLTCNLRYRQGILVRMLACHAAPRVQIAGGWGGEK